MARRVRGTLGPAMKIDNSQTLAETGIIASFSRHARSYDKHARLQKTMAERLASLLPAGPAGRVIELGCGTGVFTRHLLALPIRELILNDIAPPMIDCLKEQIALPPGTRFLLGNAESLEFPEADLVAANAVFQWFQRPRQTLRHLNERLRPGGMLVFSTFLPGTLSEFRDAVGLESPSLLKPLEEWAEDLESAGFVVEEAARETRKTFSDDTRTLISNLQQIGAAPFRMLGAGGLKRLMREYDRRHMTPQGVYATWEIGYIAARRAKR